MRTLLTILAVLLVAALCAALVVPVFVDWSAHRAEIEAKLSHWSGARVSVAGPISIRLLPIPVVSLTDVTLTGEGARSPTLSVASARLEVALVKLAGGVVRFSDASLERPTLTITRVAGGGLAVPDAPSKARARAIGFDRLAIHDGAVRIVEADAGRSIAISGVQLDASAPSLDGAIRGSGRFSAWRDTPVVFSFLSGSVLADATPLKAALDIGGGAYALDLDGEIDRASSEGAVAFRYSGAAELAGLTAEGSAQAPIPWRVSGQTKADLSGVAVEAADLRLGADERALRASGPIKLAFGSPASLSAQLSAKQMNIDALLRRKDEDGVAPARALAAFATAFGSSRFGADWPVKAQVDLAVETAVLGTQPLSNLSLNAKAAPGGPLTTRFDIALPGASRLRGVGDWEVGAAPRYRGALDFAIGEIGPLNAWASAEAPGLAARLAALDEAAPYRSAALTGDIEASSVGFAARNLRLTLDRSTLTGALVWTRAVGADPGRLYMDLRSDSLDVDTLPNLGASADLLGDLDLSLAVEAGSLHIARVGEAEVDSGSLKLKISKAGPEVLLDRLTIDGLGGASIEAKGAAGRAGRSLSGMLRADKLRDFAFLVSRVLPGEASRLLLERADALSPIALSFEARGGAQQPQALGLDTLKIDGSIGRSAMSLALDRAPAGEGRTASLGLDAPDASALLRQLGLPGSANPSGRAHIAATARGTWDGGFDAEASATLAGTDLTWRGRLAPAASDEADAALFGSATIKSANAAPLMAALGLAPPESAPLGPVDVSSGVTLRGDRWSFPRLSGALAGVKLTGSLGFRPKPDNLAEALGAPDLHLAEEATGANANPTPDVAEIEGDLSFDRLSLGSLLALELGAARPAKAGSRWSDARFGAAPIVPPPTKVHVRADALEIATALQGRSLEANLRLGRDRLDLDDLTMKIAGGVAGGRATLRRDGGLATLTGALSVDSVALDRSDLTGRLSGALDFASTGASMAALIEGLAGGGQAKLADGSLAHSDPGALDRVVAKAQAPDATLDETNIGHALEIELDRAPLAIPDQVYPLALSAGVATIGPAAIPLAKGGAALSAVFDARALTLETRLALTGVDTTKFWSGPAPAAAVVVKNAFETPQRQLDVSALAAGLSAQALARESDRIATLDADIRERAWFNRRMKAEEHMRLRAGELAAWAVEQTRLKSLAERRHAEAEAERAAVEKAAAEKAAAEKAAAEKAAAEKAAAEKAAADRVIAPAPVAGKPASADGEPAPGEPLGANSAPPSASPANPPLPPVKPKAAPPPDPALNGLY